MKREPAPEAQVLQRTPAAKVHSSENVAEAARLKLVHLQNAKVSAALSSPAAAQHVHLTPAAAGTGMMRPAQIVEAAPSTPLSGPPAYRCLCGTRIALDDAFCSNCGKARGQSLRVCAGSGSTTPTSGASLRGSSGWPPRMRTSSAATTPTSGASTPASGGSFRGNSYWYPSSACSHASTPRSFVSGM